MINNEPVNYTSVELEEVASLKDEFSFIRDSADAYTSMNFEQFAQLYIVCDLFKPDIILELGRGAGNSTGLFTLWTNHNKQGKILSLCNTSIWQEITVPKLRDKYPAKWFQNTEAITIQNMVTHPVAEVLKSYDNVLVFWDAHGYDTAEYVLGHILPAIATKRHCVLMHDVTDLSYHTISTSYQKQRLWRNSNANEGLPRLRLNNFDFFSEQFISVFDFANRNQVKLASLEAFFDTPPFKELNPLAHTLFGPGLFLDCHMLFFSLNSSQRNYTFPAFDMSAILNDTHLPLPKNLSKEQIDEVVKGLHQFYAFYEQGKHAKVVTYDDEQFSGYVKTRFIRQLAIRMQQVYEFIFRAR